MNLNFDLCLTGTTNNSAHMYVYVIKSSLQTSLYMFDVIFQSIIKLMLILISSVFPLKKDRLLWSSGLASLALTIGSTLMIIPSKSTDLINRIIYMVITYHHLHNHCSANPHHQRA